ncbi:MAG: hypothetical protein Q8R90_04845 [Bacteroidales bacterium]|jgi:hypothetical protein|nr:hypothetical protein [Bacteroidales bacterium]
MINKILEFVKKEWLWFAGGAAGALGGYLYWFFIGCNSGTCSITSSPVNSTLYGILLGGLIFSLFKKKERDDKQNHKNE